MDKLKDILSLAGIGTAGLEPPIGVRYKENIELCIVWELVLRSIVKYKNTLISVIRLLFLIHLGI